MDKYLGKRLDGRYELAELVGIGGMANVYKARDIVDNKEVAVKILKDEFVGNDEFLRRFRNESKAVATLSHPNIVKIFDVNFGDRIQYIVMEYVDGITLKEYIEQNTVLKWKDAVHFVVQILRALSHAHDKGVVHRDIKPHNIMLLSDGTIKVMDFGIARFARDEGKTGDMAIGSVHYISPEQARGDFTDERSDIYSTGIMLYEMLPGHLPFEGESLEKVAVMQMQSMATLPRAYNSSIPEGLEEIIVCAMQKEPKMRYQTASEMLRDIDEFKRNPSILFQYKYFNSDSDTRYFNAVSNMGDAPVPYDDDSEEKKKNYTIPILAGVAGAVVLLAVIVIIAFLSMDKGVDIVMPDLKGLVYNDVIKGEYKDFKFQFDPNKEEDTPYDNEYPNGTICFQDVAPGSSVKSKAKIKVRVSRGPQPSEVPDVYNMTFAEAKEHLEAAGFKVTEVKKQSDDVAQGSVVLTNPPRRSAYEKGKEVTVYVSVGPQKVQATVPNVVGKTEEEARSAISAANLRCSVGSRIDSDKPAGEVLSQNPGSGARVEDGDLVTITVSTGTPPKPAETKITLSVPIPSFAKGAYRVTWTQKGNTVKSETFTDVSTIGGKLTCEVKGTENGQIVAVYVNKTTAGTSLGNELARWTVDFKDNKSNREKHDPDAFSGGASQVTVPNVVNKLEPEAKTMLTAAKLKYKVVPKDDTSAAGTVIAQSPAAGTKVDENTEVTITVSTGIAPMVLPRRPANILAFTKWALSLSFFITTSN